MPTLEWIGKDKVVNHHQEVPYRMLERQYSYDEQGQHKADNGSENMIIHGDNLEALKALLPMYEGKVKCIYIDPPYNTAKSSEKNKSWVYSDNVDHPQIKAWLNTTVHDEGEDLTRHDKWLCMMYPRLKLLYKLLDDAGIIFISIDDNEVNNLRYICDEIFGRKSFISQLVWRSDGNFDNQAKIKNCHEYILCYIKKPDLLGLPNGIDPNVTNKSKIFKNEIRNTLVKNGPKNPMSTVELPKGFPCAVENLVIEKRRTSFPYYHQKAVIREGKLTSSVVVESGWSSKNILLDFISNHFQPVLDSKGQLTTFEITKTGAIEMVKKRESVSHVLSVLSNLGSTQNMSNELATMGIKFDFPKPTDLIQYLLGFYCQKDSVILDSFAGSGEGKKAVDGTGGSFSYYELGPVLLHPDGNLNEEVGTQKIREYVYYMETKEPIPTEQPVNEPYFMGKCRSTVYYFYYEPETVTTLDYSFLATLQTPAEGYTIYADLCVIPLDDLRKKNITFKKIPHNIAIP